MSHPLDFVAIGDTTVDEFIRLKEAHISCDIDTEKCTITMGWGDKIPYESTELVAGVGNAANAAVAAARLGLSSGFISNVGNDRFGEETLAVFRKEGISTDHIAVHDSIPTNHHYVLLYEGERTILIRHESYPYAMPEAFAAPKWLYLSSAGESATTFYDELVAWLKEHPETKLAFQPGTFQIKAGKDRLAALYAASEFVACNKQEAERILEIGETDMHILLEKIRALGPKIVLITDGTNGAFISDGTESFRVPMYPDPKRPVDRTGAGDATTSTVVVALMLGKTLGEALAWGPVNASSVVQQIGAQKGLLTRETLESIIANAPTNYRVESF